MTWNDVVAKAINYFEDNMSDLEEVLREGEMYDLYGWHPMSDLQDEFGILNPLEIMELAVKSYDKYDFTTDDDFFHTAEDGLLESVDVVDYRDYLGADMITEIYNRRDDLELPTYIKRLFESFVEDFGDEEEDEE